MHGQHFEWNDGLNFFLWRLIVFHVLISPCLVPYSFVPPSFLSYSNHLHAFTWFLLLTLECFPKHLHTAWWRHHHNGSHWKFKLIVYVHNHFGHIYWWIIWKPLTFYGQIGVASNQIHAWEDTVLELITSSQTFRTKTLIKLEICLLSGHFLAWNEI